MKMKTNKKQRESTEDRGSGDVVELASLKSFQQVVFL